MAAESPEPMIKGAALGEFLSYYVHNHAGDRFPTLVQELPAGSRAFIRQEAVGFGILPFQWYPMRDVRPLFDAISASLSPAERARVVRGAANAVMEKTLKGLYKLLFKLLVSPDKYVTQAQKVWEMYHNTGTVVYESTTANEHISTLGGWTGHHGLICDINLQCVYFIYGAMGCKGLRAERTHCVDLGAKACRTRVVWE